MIRRTLMYLIPIVLGLAILLTARHLDSTPRLPDTQPEDQTSPAQTLVPTYSWEPEETQPEDTLPAETEADEISRPEDRILLTFAGDCTLGSHDYYEGAGYGFRLTVGEDYEYPFRNVVSYFEADDLTLVNLEGALTTTGYPAGARYSFKGLPEYVQILTENSVEGVSLANNHSGDYGEEGYASTKKVLEDAGVSYVERDDSTVITLENGIKVGLYGAVYYKLDAKVITQEIRKLRENGADIVIFVPHWGAEGAYRPAQDQIELAHQAIDAGADIVFGSHPHVLQPIEEYKDGVIFYSLANFCFGGNIYPGDLDTALIQQEFVRDETGKLALGERTVVPCSVSSITERNNYQPTPYAEGTEEYQRTMSKLDGTFTGRNLKVS